MYTQIYGFLDKTNQLFQSQYGFRTNHGCDHAVGELLSEIVKNLERNNPTVCIPEILDHKTIEIQDHGLNNENFFFNKTMVLTN